MLPRFYMSLRPIADLIAKQLSGIFSGIDTDNIQSSIWDGTLELTDLMLNKSRLNPKLGSVRILSSHVDKVTSIFHSQCPILGPRFHPMEARIRRFCYIRDGWTKSAIAMR